MAYNGVSPPMAEDHSLNKSQDHGYNNETGGDSANLESQTKKQRFEKNDPFGDESAGEVGAVKYVTMSWW